MEDKRMKVAVNMEPANAATRRLLAVLLIGILLGTEFAGAIHAGNPEIAAGKRADPVFPGGYKRIVYDHGCLAYSFHELNEEGFIQSYSDMRDFGIDAVANDAVIVYRVKEISEKLGLSDKDYEQRFRGLQRQLERHERIGFSPKEYCDKTIAAIQTNRMDFWLYSYDGYYRIDEYHKQSELILEQFRESARQFAGRAGFMGFAYSEPMPGKSYAPELLAEFRRRLLSRYTVEQLKKMGLAALISPDVKLLAPLSIIVVDADTTPWLSGKHADFVRERLLGRDLGEPGVAVEPAENTSAQEFRQWILKKYSDKELQAEGLDALLRDDTILILPGNDDAREVGGGGVDSDITDIVGDLGAKHDTDDTGPDIVMPADYVENPVLFMEYEEFLGKLYVDMLGKMDDILTDMAPNASTMPCLSFGGMLTAPLRRSVAQLGMACSAISVEPYWDGAQEAGFWAKIMRTQARGPSHLLICAGGRYSTGPELYARDIASCMVHSSALQIWSWGYVWKVPCKSHAAYWRKGHYEITRRMFERIGKVKEYLAPSESVGRVALVYSERESMWDQNDPAWAVRETMSYMRTWPRPGGFVDNCYGLHCAFSQLGIQYDPIFEQLITEQELDQYSVIILPGISYLRPESVSAIRNMVHKGGQLIVLGETGTKDKWGRCVKSSSLQKLLGVSSTSATGLTGFAFESGADRRIDVEYKSDLMAVTYVAEGAEIIGKWNDGDPAVTVNNFGKGRAFCVGASRIGACYEGWGSGTRYASVFPMRKSYGQGVTEFLNGIIASALGSEKESAPLQTLVRPLETEVTVRRQPGRYIVHLLNYIPEESPVSGAEILLRVPEGKKPLAVFYPVDKSRAAYSVNGRDVTVKVRDFDVHEMLVVQFEGRAPDLSPECEGVFVFGIPQVQEGRSVAFFGAYPGVSVAEECGIPVREYPSSFLDEPIDYQEFSRKHFMIAYNGRELSARRLKHLEKYVTEGGFLQLFMYTIGLGKNDLSGTAKKSGSYHPARIRFKGRHPFFEGIGRDEWLDVKPGEGDQLMCTFYSVGSTNDVLAEADLKLFYRGQKLTDISKGVHPVIVFRRHGEGWVMRDGTVSAISSSGQLNPTFKTLASNILKWASMRK